MSWLTDPKLFNVIIMFCFLAAALRWAFVPHWGQVIYWVSSATLTIAVTWGMSK